VTTRNTDLRDASLARCCARFGSETGWRSNVQFGVNPAGRVDGRARDESAAGFVAVFRTRFKGHRLSMATKVDSKLAVGLHADESQRHHRRLDDGSSSSRPSDYVVTKISRALGFEKFPAPPQADQMYEVGRR